MKLGCLSQNILYFNSTAIATTQWFCSPPSGSFLPQTTEGARARSLQVAKANAAEDDVQPQGAQGVFGSLLFECFGRLRACGVGCGQGQQECRADEMAAPSFILFSKILERLFEIH